MYTLRKSTAMPVRKKDRKLVKAERLRAMLLKGKEEGLF